MNTSNHSLVDIRSMNTSKHSLVDIRIQQFQTQNRDIVYLFRYHYRHWGNTGPGLCMNTGMCIAVNITVAGMYFAKNEPETPAESYLYFTFPLLARLAIYRNEL